MGSAGFATVTVEMVERMKSTVVLRQPVAARSSGAEYSTLCVH